MSYTLFVILPSEDVCSLRRLAPCSSVRAVRKKLEVASGLPAQTYDLTCPEGTLLADDTVLQLDKNVWDGYVMRAVFRDAWQDLYDVVVAGDAERVLEQCTVRGQNAADDARVKAGAAERGAVALYLASFLGSADLCHAVLGVGVSPDSRTPFGRTPLFAAMSGDHVHILELLLSHHAALATYDVDGTSALDVAREHQAKECLRKVRHLKLFTRAGSATSSTASRASARGSGPSAGRKEQPRVIRIPTGAAEEADIPVSCENDNAPTVKSYEEGGCLSPAASDSSARPREPTATDGAPKVPATPTPGSRPSPRTLFRHTEVYTWDNNLRSVSRASSAAGTQVRIPVPANRRERLPSGRSSRASNGPGVNCSDTACASPGTGRRRSLRPSVQDLSIAGPTIVLKVPRPVSPPQTNHTTDRKRTDACNLHQEPGSVPDADQMKEAHCPAEEPPERPPSQNEQCQASTKEGKSVLAGSICITVPDVERTQKGDSDTFHDPEPEITCHRPARRKDSRPSPRPGPNLAKSRRKQHASLRTMKRRLKLAEDQKRTASPKSTAKQRHGKDAARASFEQWLERKRKEKEPQSDSSEVESSSEDDEDRTVENERAFNDWLRELKERPLRGPHPFAAVSLHRRKSRPLKNLIQVGGNTGETVVSPDPDGYMTAYKDWRRRNSSTTDSEEPLTSPRDIKEAKIRVEEKRKSLLAMALTYEDWLEHSEQRQKLMQAMLREDSNKLAHTKQTTLRTRRAPRQISFHEWRERLERRETELRHQEKQHLQRPEDSQLYDKYGYLVSDGTRSSAAIPHEEWLRRKKEELLKSKHAQKAAAGEKPRCSGSVTVAKEQDTSPTKGQVGNPSADDRQKRSVSESEDGKENTAWDMWLQRKHENEMEQLSRNLYEGKQLMLNVHHKKTARVTHC